MKEKNDQNQNDIDEENEFIHPKELSQFQIEWKKNLRQVTAQLRKKKGQIQQEKTLQMEHRKQALDDIQMKYFKIKQDLIKQNEYRLQKLNEQNFSDENQASEIEEKGGDAKLFLIKRQIERQKIEIEKKKWLKMEKAKQKILTKVKKEDERERREEKKLKEATKIMDEIIKLKGRWDTATQYFKTSDSVPIHQNMKISSFKKEDETFIESKIKHNSEFNPFLTHSTINQ